MKKKSTSILLLAILALAYWKFPHLFEKGDAQSSKSNNEMKQTHYMPDQADFAGAENASFKHDKEGAYAIFSGCQLIKEKGNDGDSFWVKLPNSKKLQVRLYFVDAPESDKKFYGNGQSNLKRLGHQARYFGMELDAVVKIGQSAKKSVLEILERGDFEVLTAFKRVFESERVYAFIRVSIGDEKRYLHELLVEQGVARIYTEGAETPEGKSRAAQTSRLKGLEKIARDKRLGGWSH